MKRIYFSDPVPNDDENDYESIQHEAEFGGGPDK